MAPRVTGAPAPGMSALVAPLPARFGRVRAWAPPSRRGCATAKNGSALHVIAPHGPHASPDLCAEGPGRPRDPPAACVAGSRPELGVVPGVLSRTELCANHRGPALAGQRARECGRAQLRHWNHGTGPAPPVRSSIRARRWLAIHPLGDTAPSCPRSGGWPTLLGAPHRRERLDEKVAPPVFLREMPDAPGFSICYGKGRSGPGRKIGHITFSGGWAENRRRHPAKLREPPPSESGTLWFCPHGQWGTDGSRHRFLRSTGLGKAPRVGVIHGQRQRRREADAAAALAEFDIPNRGIGWWSSLAPPR